MMHHSRGNRLVSGPINRVSWLCPWWWWWCGICG